MIILCLDLGKTASIAFGRQGSWAEVQGTNLGSFLDRDKTSVVMSSGIQAMMVAGTRDRFTGTSYLLKVQVETYKV